MERTVAVSATVLTHSTASRKASTGTRRPDRRGDVGPRTGPSGFAIGSALTHPAYAEYQLLCMNDET
ncbi:hypothetical protein GCM10010253_08090 [Streptomyces badius]|uniref:Uncharacterized protein n=1 Tax=Streptomyces badius TaxID=1941 RepID=A0ABQ2ST87_STRBA|nr:hypothetical protein GCM10010253_08090 [Streptomyces badius]